MGWRVRKYLKVDGLDGGEVLGGEVLEDGWNGG